ncbi:MAG: YolD-like family protein [Bacillota bacterium]
MPSLYHDRKMLKWLPFEALEPQREALRRVFRKNSESAMPDLSPDQQLQNQYKVEESLKTGETVQIIYFHEQHRYKVFSPIERVDTEKGVLYTKNHCLALEKIIEVT